MAKITEDKLRKIEEVLTRNVEDVIDKDRLREKLLSGKKLRIKHGIDPTGDKIHIGRAVVLWKLREFQDLGHKIVLIIGDFTAQIGDPSDKLAKRPFLAKDAVKKNLKGYLPQIGKILNLKKVEVRYNSEWLAKLNFREISELAENFTIQQMIERRNFRERWEKHEEIGLREFMYPLMQGYDSVAVKADVELGGTDQLFNLMAGRKIQERYRQRPQEVMTTAMLSGTDGRKMSTSWGNVINIIDPADDMFGKVMSVRDEEILNYFEFATDVSRAAIKSHEDALRMGANPKVIKIMLAREIVARYHGKDRAEEAEDKWNRLFSKKEISAEGLKELRLASKKITAADLVLASGVVKSKSEAWRLVGQGGLYVNDQRKQDPKGILHLEGGEVVKVGKKNFFRVK